MSKPFKALQSLKNRLNVFYVLAFAPLLLILGLHVDWPFVAVIPLYGFIVLILKKNDLSLYGEANNVQRALGIIFVFGSFFIYYPLTLLFPYVGFYGGANYVVYLFGLFLTFFEFSALKEAFTSLFLIVAATSSSFVADWLEPYLSPLVPSFLYLVEIILKMLGVRVIVNYPMITVGGLPLPFAYGCVGVYSTLVFSVILVTLLFEEPSGVKTKVLWSVVGLLGTWTMNVIRVVIILLADYYYGSEVGAYVHYGVGYVLFIAWLVLFFYLFSKRQTILEKVHLIRQKL